MNRSRSPSTRGRVLRERPWRLPVRADNREHDADEPKKAVWSRTRIWTSTQRVVRQRISMAAAVRLAGLLNRALGAQSPETSPRTELLGPG
jgi:hypothetical protein